MRLCLLIALAASLFAQNETASLAGRVVDPTGLGVPAAEIQLTRSATGAVRTDKTGASGEYRFDLLDPGDYTIRVTAAGFKTVEDSAIQLHVAQSSQFDVPLTVGAVTDRVVVEAGVSTLEAQSIAQGAVIGQEKVKALPLNGRQFLQLALLSPATNSGGIAVQQNAVRQGEVAGLSVAGTRTNDSAYLLDGVINTDPDYNALNYVPIVDAIAEFQVQVAQYSAEYGRASGGQINVLTQSGSNQWHALGWEFLRNSVFDARPFNLTTQSSVPEFRRNQYGGLIGGPVVKNKLFAFFDYEGLQVRQAAANLTTTGVPDALQRQGNFSEEIGTTVIYDPTTPLASGARTPFPGNIIPANRIDPSVSAAMNVLPLPNLPGSFYINTVDLLTQNFNNVSGRADYQLNDKMKLFARISGAGENASIPVVLPDRSNLDDAAPRNAAVGYTDVVSANKVNDLRLGFSRLNFLYGLPELEFDVNGNETKLPNFIIGSLNFGGAGPYNATGQGGIARARNNVYQGWDVFAWQHGRHNIRFGGEFDEFQYVRYEYADPLGSLTFTNGYTDMTAAAPKATDHSGDAYATALLGLPEAATRTIGPNRMDGRQYNYAGFFQDDIRVTTTFTVNAGIRYELSPPMYDIHHQMASIDYSTVPWSATILANGQQGIYSPKLFVCGEDGYPQGCAYTNKHDFSPRLGFAWQVNSKTVIRAGGGIYYATQDANTLLKMAQQLPTTYAQTLTLNAYVPSSTVENVFTPAIVGSQSVSGASLDLHQGAPYSPQWSFNIQRTLAPQLMLEVGYLGTDGIHLEQNVQPNNGLPGAAKKLPYYGLALDSSVVAALNFPYTTTTVPVGSINYYPHSAQSNYHALLTRLERRFKGGFSLLSAFTYAKAISNAPQYRNAGGITGDENSPPQNSYDLAAERSLAYFNLKFRWVTTAVYDLPFGKGHQLLPDGAGAAILGGWQISGIYQFQTGFPFTIDYKGDPFNIGGGSGGILERPNVVLQSSGQPLSPNLPSNQRSTSEWFNTAAFYQPPTGQFGNVGRNTLQGANLSNLDATIARMFRIGERVTLQFRAEFFDLANHSNYNLIGRIINDPTYGIVQNQLPPRQIQFGFKVGF